MSYKAMYRVFRPTDFNELVGQEHISTTLKNALKTDRLAHAYLFCGPRGTGKTSSAKILAKAVNCLNPSTASRAITALIVRRSTRTDFPTSLKLTPRPTAVLTRYASSGTKYALLRQTAKRKSISSMKYIC